MALTLNGSTRWPSAKELRRFGETRMEGTPSRIKQILEGIGDAISQTTGEVRSYIKQHSDFAEIGESKNGRKAQLSRSGWPHRRRSHTARVAGRSLVFVFDGPRRGRGL